MLLNENMNVYEYYVDHCKNNSWYAKYYSCGKRGDGSLYKFMNTNFRNLNAFEYYFNDFKTKYAGVLRSTWERKEDTKEEIAKQHVTNMRQTDLFMCERRGDNDSIYKMTGKGSAFEKMLNSGFKKEEKTLLTYLFVVNSPFFYSPKYILTQTKMLLDTWAKEEIDIKSILKEIERFVSEYYGKDFNEDIFNYDSVWCLGFYSDKDFIYFYSMANEETLNMLHETTIEDYKKSNKNNVLSYKFKGTNFSILTLVDTFIVIYLSERILGMAESHPNFITFYSNLVNAYSNLLKINRDKIMDFIVNNEDVFKVIYYNCVSEEEDFIGNYVPKNTTDTKLDIVESIVEKKIDPTTTSGAQQLETVREYLKKLAKEKTHYKCALEVLNNCHYFKSKADGNNYLEVHHLVPREHACDFDDTIEFLGNYVPLCPSCHRQLHHGTDETRKQLLTFLYNSRKEELEKNNIHITLKDLLKYYKVDN